MEGKYFSQIVFLFLPTKINLTYVNFGYSINIKLKFSVCVEISPLISRIYPFSSENFLELFDGINLIKINYFDIKDMTKQLKYSYKNSVSIFHLIIIIRSLY